MRKFYILLLGFLLLCSCSSTNIFNGDILNYTNEVTKDEWLLKQNEIINSSEVLGLEVNRDLSSISKYYYENKSIKDDTVIDLIDDVINVSYDAENKIVATVYDNDFSTRFCSLISSGKLYNIKIVNLEIVDKKTEASYNEFTLVNKARSSFNLRIDDPRIIMENYYDMYQDIECRYYIDSNQFTLTIDYDADVKINGVFQYVFTKKYVCLNYVVKYIDDSISSTTKLCSYILLEEVEIAPIKI